MTLVAEGLIHTYLRTPTKLPAGWSAVRIPVEAKDFTLLQNSPC